MSDVQSAFIKKPLACPACRKTCPQRFFRQRMFVADEKEPDQHVVKYKWLNASVEPVNPAHYFLLHCPFCFYTDTTEDFANALQTDKGVFAVKAFKGLSGKRRALVDLLGKHVDYDAVDFRSALNLHFLAVLTQMFSEKEQWDHYKIARLVLRVAWLYRENAPETKETERLASVEQALERVGAVEGALQEGQAAWEGLGEALDARIEELGGESASNPYAALKTEFGQALEALITATHRLKNTCKQDLAGDLASAGAAEEAYHEFPSYEAFLSKVKAWWPFLPMDEREAMQSAIRYYDRALSTDARFDSPNAQFVVISLMADLHVRCDDVDAAFAMIRGMYKAASDSRVAARRKLQEQPDLDEAAKRRLGAQIRRAGTLLSQAGDLRHSLLNHLVERDTPRIREILAAHATATEEMRESVLEQNGIAPGLIAHLKETGALRPTK